MTTPEPSSQPSTWPPTTTMPSADDTSVGKDIDLNNPREWGQAVKEEHAHGGKPSLYVRDFGNGRKIFTFVVWADTK